MRDHRKCSQCDVKVTEDNEQYKQYIQTLQFLFPTVAAGDDVNAAGQSSGPTNDESRSHIVITTLSGECTTLPYNPDQTIVEVNDIVEKELKTPCKKQCLLYNEIELKVLILFIVKLFYIKDLERRLQTERRRSEVCAIKTEGNTFPYRPSKRG